MSEVSHDSSNPEPLSAEKAAPAVDPPSKMKVLLPYIIALAAQTPLLLYYFADLWWRPHYQFFPFALLMVGVFGYMRWPRNQEQPFIRRRTSTVLFWMGVVFGIAGALFAAKWFAAASMVCLMTSLFAMTKDREVSGKTLLVLGLPLLIILMPPNNLDFRLITQLQQVSAKVSSWYLDILNFKHHSPGTTLNFPGNQNYEVERACSGVQSFFTLMFCTSFLIVSLRRPWFRGIILLIAAAFWAVLMNSVRILIIPIADIMFGIKLLEGLPHDLLGYSVMLVAVLLILSTDQLLEFMFGRSGESSTESNEKSFVAWLTPRWVSKLFNKLSEDEEKEKQFRPVERLFVTSALAGSIVLTLFGGLQLYDFYQSLSRPNYKIRFFNNDPIVDVDKLAMPKTIRSGEVKNNVSEFEWQQLGHKRFDRERGSDFGQRSDQWFFVNRRGLRFVASLDQPFPGWHELTTCYKNQGWRYYKSGRVKKPSTFVNEQGEELEWSYIEVKMVNPTTSQYGFLLFCFCDAGGTPFEAPIEWGSLRSFVERAKNRLTPSARASLFRGQAYQMQVFVSAPVEITDPMLDEFRSQFFEIRNEMRSSLLKYGDGGEFAESGNPDGDSESGEDASDTGSDSENGSDAGNQ